MCSRFRQVFFHRDVLFFGICPVPDMTYNVFGGTLSLTQSTNLVFVILLQVHKVNFIEQRANFDAFTCIIKICYLFKKIHLTYLQTI